MPRKKRRNPFERAHLLRIECITHTIAANTNAITIMIENKHDHHVGHNDDDDEDDDEEPKTIRVYLYRL